MKALRKISLRYQFMAWMGLAVTLSVLATGYIIQVRVKDNMEKQVAASLTTSANGLQHMVTTALTITIRSHLRGIAEKNVDILERLYLDTLAGKLTEQEARTLAKKVLLSQSIGDTGYIYAIDGKGVIRIHPNEKMQNRDMSGHWLAKAQVAEKTGYLEYRWKNPGEENERNKALYMSYFPPWDLIVSVSSYKEEFISLFVLETLQSDILSFGSEQTGDVFILDSRGHLLVRSDHSGSGIASGLNRDWQKIFQTMTQEKNGRLRRTVQEKDGSGDLLVFYRYVPDLDWYVGSWIHVSVMDARLNQVQTLIMATAVLMLLLLLPAALLVGKEMTRPIARLAEKMDQAGGEDFDIRADEGGLGEVGELARHFNTYMDALKVTNQRLIQEIEKRDLAEGQQRLFTEVFKNALEGISITDAQGNIIAVNQAFTKITGYTQEEALGRNPRILKSDRHEPAFYEEMWRRITTEGIWEGEIWNRRKNGEAYPEILSISAIRNSKGKTTHYVAVFHDISEMKSQQEAIEHQAFHDALTGLPNRYLAQDRLDMALKHARRKRDRVAVFFLDMDNFKFVNDSLGHTAGDQLLQKFGLRLLEQVRDEDTVARLGGDEFLVIAQNIQSEPEVLDLADRLIEGMQSAFEIDKTELRVTFSLGITNYPEDGGDSQTLIKNADVAMYEAKAKGKNKYAVFTPALRASAALRMDLVQEFRRALEEGEFKVYYQPKVSPARNRVLGVEALVRWEKADGSLVSPADFIPLAEETGLIIPLGYQVLKTACRDIQEMNTRLPEPLTLAVNLSPLQFGQRDILDHVLDLLAESGLAPGLLELEITESTMMTDLEATVKRLGIFKDEGISIAIDDFGTGYSSLYYLKTFPISTLKVDRSFVRDMTLDRTDDKIVETIILMARNLGLNVVAEGVETLEQLERLMSYGCDQVQGFFFAKPMPREAAATYCLEMNTKKDA
jgi:diguanylate cyclase (GGDEF)-like protein/PAS domain S-box-containing protein